MPVSDERAFFGVIPNHIYKRGHEDINYYIAKYDAKIRTLDDQIGLLLQGLKELNLYNNTLVVLLADHGEALGEHNLYFRHGVTLYDEILKVPLIIKYPHLIVDNGVVNTQVALIDVVPTILDILGIDQKEKINMTGKSLIPCITGKEVCGDEYVFSDINDNDLLYSIRTEDWKLIYANLEKIRKNPAGLEACFRDYSNKDYYTSKYELYNLKDDPFETKNLSNDIKYSKTLEDLKERLNKYVDIAQRIQAEKRNWLEKEGDGDMQSLDEETKERLKALGYVQ